MYTFFSSSEMIPVGKKKVFQKIEEGKVGGTCRSGFDDGLYISITRYDTHTHTTTLLNNKNSDATDDIYIK
jgi:hypothetical protein